MNSICKSICIRIVHQVIDAPDVVNDEAGGGDEEVVHPVEVPADWLCVHGVVRHSSTGLINHLVNTNGEGGGW